MIRLTLVGLLVVMALATLGQAPPPLPEKGNPAVKPAEQNNSATPVKGANSFTSAQAKRRIEDGGYEAGSELKKGDDGVWRGKGMRGRSQFEVSVDYQGNVSGRYLQDLSTQ